MFLISFCQKNCLFETAPLYLSPNHSSFFRLLSSFFNSFGIVYFVFFYFTVLFFFVLLLFMLLLLSLTYVLLLCFCSCGIIVVGELQSRALDPLFASLLSSAFVALLVRKNVIGFGLLTAAMQTKAKNKKQLEWTHIFIHSKSRQMVNLSILFD